MKLDSENYKWIATKLEVKGRNLVYEVEGELIVMPKDPLGFGKYLNK